VDDSAGVGRGGGSFAISLALTLDDPRNGRKENSEIPKLSPTAFHTDRARYPFRVSSGPLATIRLIVDATI
jgi:hypothetical protein